MPVRPLSRRTLLRAAGACIALPCLEAMLPRKASAQTETKQRFIAFFYPNGTDPRSWNPSPGPLSAGALPACLSDLNGFATEGIWPAGEATLSDVTVVTGINHSGVCVDIHMPSMSLTAHRGAIEPYFPSEPTLDQVIAEQIKGSTPFRNLSLSATPSTDIGQGHISFRAGGQAETVIRNPSQLFDLLFADGAGNATAEEAERLARRQGSVLDVVLADANRLRGRVGAADKQRLDQYFNAISELEQQVTRVPTTGCMVPAEPERASDWHTKSKQFIDLSVLALACDLTNVITIQYSDSWGVNYGDYQLGTGIESVGTWSDHFLSHKLDDTDRATDLDGLARAEAQRIADARVIATSRFKVRRFSYLVNALKNTVTPTGTLLDESLALYISENGDGDSHARTNMPILLAGHAGGFETGRAVSATDRTTGSLHASILQRFGIDAGNYGDPGGTALAEL